MQTKTLTGIIVSKSIYLDNDEILNVLTSNSLIKIYAKGVRKIESKNRPNVVLGAIVDFEILEAYSTFDFCLLKKATLIQELPPISKNNASKIETIIRIIQKIHSFSSDVYEVYSLLIHNFESINFFKIQTFLISKILESNGEGLSFSRCVYCSTKQNLFSFNVNEGGMLCKSHGSQKTPLDLLKSFYFIGQSLEKYIQFASTETNKKIFDILNSLLF